MKFQIKKEYKRWSAYLGNVLLAEAKTKKEAIRLGKKYKERGM
jgi:hypothetical protein